MDIDTTNYQFVSRQGNCIIVMRPQVRMTVEEALRHAAWLVSITGQDERFKEILQAIRNA